MLTPEHHAERFQGAVVGLGGLGVVTKLTLDVVPAFEMRQDVYENLPMAQVAAHFDAITSSAYSISLFTDWQNERFNQVWLKRRVTDGATSALPPEWFEATLAPTHRHPITELSAANCTRQMGIPGPCMDEPMLPAGMRGDPLYVEKELARGQKGASADRRTPRTVQCPPALGQAIYDATAGTTITLREAAGLSTTVAVVRSSGQIPQCVFGHVRLWRALSDQT